MTTAQKFLGFLILEAAVVAGAYGGGYYKAHKETVAAQTEAAAARAKLEAQQSGAVRAIQLAHGRSSLVEAALGVMAGNNGLAFDRMVRAQSGARSLDLKLEKEFDELTVLLVSQDEKARDKLLSLADKFESPPPLLPPELTRVTGKGAPAAQAKPGAPGAPGAPAAPGAPSAPGAPAAGSAQAVAAPAMPVMPGATAPTARISATADRSFQEGREALIQAKVLLLSGDTAQVAQKLALALTMFNESGHGELDEELSAAIRAARGKDEAKARAAIEAALTKLRAM